MFRPQPSRVNSRWVIVSTSLSRRAALDDSFHHSLAKIIGKRHSRRLLHAAGVMNQNAIDSGSPRDSICSKTALEKRTHMLNIDGSPSLSVGQHRHLERICLGLRRPIALSYA